MFSCREQIRVKSMTTLREQTNSIAISDSMKHCGLNVEPFDPRLTNAVEAQFEPFISRTQLVPGASDVLKLYSDHSSVAIISNFSYAPVVYKILGRLRIDSYVEGITISHEVGYRKPHEEIFNHALRALKCEAKNSVMIGDSITEDIAGAKVVGMSTVFIMNEKNAESPPEVVPDRRISRLSELLMD